MENQVKHSPGVNAERWRARVHEGKLREEENARKLQVVTSIALVTLALGAGFWSSYR